MPTRDTTGRWLFGPAPDLLLGCGLGYLLIFAGFLLAGTDRSAVSALGLVPLISILTGTPHYGATLLRVYEDAEERRKYAFFAVWITAVVWGLFYLGLYSALLGSLIVTLYLSWSPWHYTGQNYGIAVMFLRRRGVPLADGTKRLFYLSFVLSYALTLLALHGASAEGAYSAFSPYKGGSFQLMRLGIPSPWWELAFAGVAVAYLGALLLAGGRLLRVAKARDLVPSAVLVLTQMLWFVAPVAARHWGLLGPDNLLSTQKTAYAFFWVATGHSVQYLWITTYYAAGSRPLGTRLFYLARTLVAGSFIWSVPGLLYGLTLEGGPLGGVARGQDVFVLLASMVNLHHFILDGAIWKLRDGRVARILIRHEPQTVPALGPRPRRWLAPVVYTLGTLATFQVLSSFCEHQFFFERALRDGNVRAAQLSLERLGWIRSDSHVDYLRFGHLAADAGLPRLAMNAYNTSIQKQPSPAVYVAVGRMAQRAGQLDQALRAYEQALAVDPDHVESLNLVGLTWLQLGDAARAEAALARANALVPDNETLRANLERARKRLAGEGAGDAGVDLASDAPTEPAVSSPD